MHWPIMRAINTIVSIGALSGFFVASSLTLLACQKKPAEQDTVMPNSEKDTHKGDKPNDQCGGFGGLQCSDGMTCVDDPSDSCDPMQGGADCMGRCVEDKDLEGGGKNEKCDFVDTPHKNYVGQSPDACATMKFACEAGKEYFADDCGCGCVMSGMTDTGVSTPPMSNEPNMASEPKK
jgi:hypothetical protein